jgi:hypothetical protein
VDDPKAAVITALTRAVAGAHAPARPQTIRVVKERRHADLAMVAVEYDDVQDREWRGMIGLRRIGGAWAVTGGGGGSRSGEPGSPAPWANFAVVWDQRLFMAGGRVHGVGVSRVRVVSASGGAGEDSVDDGIALVMADGPFPRPWTVELYDAAGGLLRSHPCPGGRT